MSDEPQSLYLPFMNSKFMNHPDLTMRVKSHTFFKCNFIDSKIKYQVKPWQHLSSYPSWEYKKEYSHSLHDKCLYDEEQHARQWIAYMDFWFEQCFADRQLAF